MEKTLSAQVYKKNICCLKYHYWLTFSCRRKCKIFQSAALVVPKFIHAAFALLIAAAYFIYIVLVVGKTYIEHHFLIYNFHLVTCSKKCFSFKFFSRFFHAKKDRRNSCNELECRIVQYSSL